MEDSILRSLELAIKHQYNPKTAFGDTKLIGLLTQASERYEYLNSTKDCDECGGTGEEECSKCGHSTECETCGGKGRIEK